jgi:1-aminocyclopropane-1-carboxylate synthase
MRHLLHSNTFEAEMDLWKKIVYQVGLNISPGSSCHCNEPGWFRVCFANMSEETLKQAMKRLKAFVVESTGNVNGVTSRTTIQKTKSVLTKWVFRLSSRDHRDHQEER